MLGYFEGVDVNKKLPSFITERLNSLNQKSINPIVDITNYVMFELSAPLHAFDADKVLGGISVRFAKNDEELSLLGNEKVQLSQDDVVICEFDTDKSIALAGIKGGDDTGVSKNTKNIYLEVANFNQTTVRHSSKRHGIITDASQRFSQNLSPLIVFDVFDRAKELIIKYTGGKFVDYSYKTNMKDVLPQEVSLDEKYLQKIMGIDISITSAKKFLDLLDIKSQIKDNSKNQSPADQNCSTKNSYIVAIPPKERTDINIPEDLIEEVARMYGYENIPERAQQISTKTKVSKRHAYHMSVVKKLQQLDFIEIENRTWSDVGEVEVVCPQAENKNFLRTNLSTDMEEALTKNQKNKDLFGKNHTCLIEFGTIFTNTGEFFNMAISVSKSKKQDEIFNKAINALLEIGIKLDIKSKVKNTIEVDFDKIISKLETPKEYDYLETYKDKTFSKFSQYPFITRDISMFVPKNIDQISSAEIIKNNSKYLENIFLFDVFKKEEKTSLAFKLIFQSQKKTLTDEEINKVMQNIEDKLKRKGCVIR